MKQDRMCRHRPTGAYCLGAPSESKHLPAAGYGGARNLTTDEASAAKYAAANRGI